ncbi:hypothetical protein [Luethyella okanaganae]|uniref:Uncharacterized protein n=1 Tax=Luethyella okanaganae TaxID=69372 RepID=A0ABW1VHS5_9MICO
MLDHAEELAPPSRLTGHFDECLARTLVAIHESPGRLWTLVTMA